MHVLQTATTAHFENTTRRFYPVDGRLNNFNRPALGDFRFQARVFEQHPLTGQSLIDENWPTIDMRDPAALIR
jgi:hypothetical protein